MSDIFQEVEEDVRRERYEQLWQQYGNYVIALAILLVLAVAAWQGWQYYDLRQRQAISDRYQAAQQLAISGDVAKAETEFAALAKDAPQGYATLAKLHLAGTYLVQGKFDQSVALLRELVQSSDPVISSAARLRLAWTLADASPKADIVNLLQPLTGVDSPWRFAAAEVLAYIDIREGSRSDAQAEYAKLAQETDAPQSLRQRAAAIADYLKANPTEIPATRPEPAPAAMPAMAAPARPATPPRPQAAAPARPQAAPATPAQRTSTP